MGWAGPGKKGERMSRLSTVIAPEAMAHRPPLPEGHAALDLRAMDRPGRP